MGHQIAQQDGRLILQIFGCRLPRPAFFESFATCCVCRSQMVDRVIDRGDWLGRVWICRIGIASVELGRSPWPHDSIALGQCEATDTFELSMVANYVVTIASGSQQRSFEVSGDRAAQEAGIRARAVIEGWH